MSETLRPPRDMGRRWSTGRTAGAVLLVTLVCGALVPSAGAQPHPDLLVHFDAPAEGQVIGPRVPLRGWAVDRSAQGSTGLDSVHVYVDGPAGQGTLLGGGSYTPRPDVSAVLQRADWDRSGFSLDLDTSQLGSGPHTLFVHFFHSRSPDRPFVTREVHLDACVTFADWVQRAKAAGERGFPPLPRAGYECPVYLSLDPAAPPPQELPIGLAGAGLVASDGQLLGRIDGNSAEPESVCNPSGAYGSRDSAASVRNPQGRYGSVASPGGAYHATTSTPPTIVRGSEVVGYLTKNRALPNPIDPDTLLSLLSCR